MARVADSGFRRSLGTGKSLSFVSPMPPVQYFAIGSLIALAIIVSVYSKLGALLCLVCAYGLFRLGRNDDDGESLIPDLDEVRGRIKIMEVLKETDEELMVRGSERVLILNRKKGTISGLHSSHATFSKVQNIRIDQFSDEESSRISSYSVSISLGTFSSICLGYTDSQIDASVMAAKLSTWIGKHVVA